jgi:hypothetical protein
MMSAAILGAALWTAQQPLPRPGRLGEEAAAANRAAAAVPQTFNLNDWLYPGAVAMGGGGHPPLRVIPGVGQRGSKHYNRFSRTADPFDKVVDHYRKLVGLAPGDGNSTSGDADAVANSWPDRPVKLTLVSRRYGLITASAMISRDQGEAFTYITLIYRQVND